jgi:hypothetical protein
MEYKFYRKETKKWEKVEPVLWIWVAIYKDETFLRQFDDTGIYHQINEINKSMLEVFIMENIKTHQKISLNIPKGKNVFLRYENTVIAYGTSHEKKYKTFVFGYENNNFVITFNNDVIFTNDLKKVNLLTGELCM